METPIVEKVIEELRNMPQDLQWRVLEFARTLTQSTLRGVPGRDLLHFAGAISQDDIEPISEAVERGCEQVDMNKW